MTQRVFCSGCGAGLRLAADGQTDDSAVIQALVDHDCESVDDGATDLGVLPELAGP